MVAVPGPEPVTTPPDTLATPMAVLDQVPPKVASVSVAVLPVQMVAVAGLMVAIPDATVIDLVA